MNPVDLVQSPAALSAVAALGAFAFAHIVNAARATTNTTHPEQNQQVGPHRTGVVSAQAPVAAVQSPRAIHPVPVNHILRPTNSRPNVIAPLPAPTPKPVQPLTATRTPPPNRKTLIGASNTNDLTHPAIVTSPDRATVNGPRRLAKLRRTDTQTDILTPSGNGMWISLVSGALSRTMRGRRRADDDDTRTRRTDVERERERVQMSVSCTEREPDNVSRCSIEAADGGSEANTGSEVNADDIDHFDDVDIDSEEVSVPRPINHVNQVSMPDALPSDAAVFALRRLIAVSSDAVAHDEAILNLKDLTYTPLAPACVPNAKVVFAAQSACEGSSSLTSASPQQEPVPTWWDPVLTNLKRKHEEVEFDGDEKRRRVRKEEKLALRLERIARTRDAPSENPDTAANCSTSRPIAGTERVARSLVASSSSTSNLCLAETFHHALAVGSTSTPSASPAASSTSMDVDATSDAATASTSNAAGPTRNARTNARIAPYKHSAGTRVGSADLA